MKGFKRFLNRRLITVTLFGFFSGLPCALTHGTLQAWYTEAQVSLTGIGALTLVGMPYLFKFLWSPLVDRFSLLRLGRRRGWILLMQVGLCGVLLAMSTLNPHAAPFLLALLAVGVSLLSATQDIAIDAYRSDVLEVEERGLGAALNTIGYRLAILVSGALAFILAAYWGWHWTYVLMGLLFLGGVLYTPCAPNVDVAVRAPVSLKRAIVDPFREYFTRQYPIVFIAFIVLYKLGDAFAISLTTPFLLRTMQFSLIEVGAVAKTAGLSAALLGSFIGGVWLLKLGQYRALWLFGLLQLCANLLFVVLYWVGKNHALMVAAVFAQHFFGSLSSVAFVALLMGLCARSYSATQYAIFSSLSMLGSVFSGPFSAYWVLHWGWVHFYFGTFIIGLIPLLLISWIRSRVDLSAQCIGVAGCKNGLKY